MMTTEKELDRLMLLAGLETEELQRQRRIYQEASEKAKHLHENRPPQCVGCWRIPGVTCIPGCTPETKAEEGQERRTRIQEESPYQRCTADGCLQIAGENSWQLCRYHLAQPLDQPKEGQERRREWLNVRRQGVAASDIPEQCPICETALSLCGCGE